MKFKDLFPDNTIGSREHWRKVLDDSPVILQVMLFSLHVRRSSLKTATELEYADQLIQQVCERLWNLGHVPGSINNESARILQFIWQPTGIYTRTLPQFEALYGPLERDTVSVLMKNAPENIYTLVNQHRDYESRVCAAVKDLRLDIAEKWLQTAHIWSPDGLRHLSDNILYHARTHCDRFARLLVQQGNAARDIIDAMTMYRFATNMPVMDTAFFRNYDGAFPPSTLVEWMVNLHMSGKTNRLVFLVKWTDAATFDFFLTSIRAAPRVALSLLFQAISHHGPGPVRHLRRRPEWPDAHLMWLRARAMRRRITIRLPRGIEALCGGEHSAPAASSISVGTINEATD